MTEFDKFKYLENKEKATEYFKKNNFITDKFLEDTKNLQENLFNDMESRITDYTSYPVKRNGFFYFHRTFKNKQYPILYRKQDLSQSSEEVILDENILSEGSKSLIVDIIKVSPCNNYVCYGFSRSGDDLLTIEIKNIKSNKIILTIENVSSSFEWENDYFYYTVPDSNLRPFKVIKSDLNGNSEEIFKDNYESGYVYLSKSKDQSTIFIYSSSSETTQIHIIKQSKPVLFHEREDKHELYVEVLDNEYFILSNKKNKNFEIFKLEGDDTTSDWLKLISSNKRKIEGFEVFEEYLLISEKFEFEYLRVYNLKTKEEYYIDITDLPFELLSAGNYDTKSNIIHYSYSTLINPKIVYEFNLETREKKLLQEDILPNYNSKNYILKREYVNKVPITICYRKKYESSKKTWMTGYGSYGASYPLNFSNSLITLLNNGFKYVIVHVRGGGELGEDWYQQGKFLNKKNSFKDFILVAQNLIKIDFTNSDNLVISGRSAGGLLVGSVINMKPELFRTVIANVPFVDVINTMLNPDIPLTTLEYEEWGDPKNKEFYDYILSYSPYDNISMKPYPNILITTGLNDTRVKYWEPAKWHAKLKENNQGSNVILLKSNLEAGHFGFISRHERFKEKCEEYAFALKTVN